MTDEKPLSEEELAAFIAAADEADAYRSEMYDTAAVAEHWPTLEPADLRRLVAEVRRLRALMAECESTHVHVKFTKSEPVP